MSTNGSRIEEEKRPFNLRVNGQMRCLSNTMEFPPLGAVLTTLGVRKELVAIALNDTIVPRDKWDQTFVSEEDKLEIVHFVGGGCLFNDQSDQDQR